MRDGWAWATAPMAKVTADTGPQSSGLNARKGREIFVGSDRANRRFLVDLAKADVSDMYE